MCAQQTIGERPAKHSPLRWRWYHFYFLLAVFDLLVILASLVLYDRVLDSYDVALHRLGRIHRKQRWVASLRLDVIDLNAPGNDVFESHRVKEERDRFDRAELQLRQLMDRAKSYDVDLSEFESHIARMTEKEKRIFDMLAANQRPDTGANPPPDVLEHATASMAAMDRYQAAALTSLTELEQSFLVQVDRLLTQYGILLLAQESFEKYFLATVVLILIGIFWYGRKLQRMHDRMVVDHQKALAARHERLAAVGELSAAVAHGIRNPIAAISSSAQLGINAGRVDETTRHRLQDILTECRRLDERVTRLLGFASDSTEPSEEYDLRSAIEQAAEEIVPRIRERGIELTHDYDGAPLRVRGDRERMVQAVMEVLANAMNHVADDGHIQLRCRRSPERPGFADVDITDDGTGIPDAIRARVFDLFFTSRADGTGIGLASVRHTVQLHGGEVSVVPRQTGGTHIRIRLPLV